VLTTNKLHCVLKTYLAHTVHKKRILFLKKESLYRCNKFIVSSLMDKKTY